MAHEEGKWKTSIQYDLLQMCMEKHGTHEAIPFTFILSLGDMLPSLQGSNSMSHLLLAIFLNFSSLMGELNGVKMAGITPKLSRYVAVKTTVKTLEVPSFFSLLVGEVWGLNIPELLKI